MNSQTLSWLPIVSFLSFTTQFLFLQSPLCFSFPDAFFYHSCGNTTFDCGSIAGIGYPFRGHGEPEYCGYPGLDLHCQDGIATVYINNIKYRVLEIDQATQTMKIAREDILESICPQDLVNTTLDNSLFEYASSVVNLDFVYGCSTPFRLILSLIPIPSCNISGLDVYLVVGSRGPDLSCESRVTVPVAGWDGSLDLKELGQAFRGGFKVKWKVDSKGCEECTGSKGRCGFDFVNKNTTCFCPDPPYVSGTCSISTASLPATAPTQPGGGSSSQMQIVLPVVGAIIAGIGIGWGVFYCRQRKKHKAALSAQAEGKELSTPSLSKGANPPLTNFSRSIPSYHSSKSDFGKASTYFGVQVFSYSELEEATGNFDPSRELGEGGFGTVYYGVLQDGRVVAVKRLYENNFKRVEQFMNEVEILTRLRHESLVTLFGCTSKRSRELLLVYEYIPNGTVADHLHGKKANSGLLSWQVRLNIAIETADALAYLHASDIIHRDVKTNNILLDNDFRVKVADFGLSKLFPTDVTHVSTAPQGTPGYVDPEYYQCYQLTEKSDVYSFGVVLVELISSKQAVDTNRDRHDINLANMAIKKIQNHTLHELVDQSLGFETNSVVRKMATLVAELAFRCLQAEKDMRPSMEEILKTLRGIKNDEPNTQVEVVDIMVDGDVGIAKENPPPMSPDSAGTEKWVSNSSAPNFSG
ncbi:LEAF RUST 10 DISEASE-RESISTANCE LOCUS RECEPTOR-LIKE PROTEIN KINASE-like 1.4 isoform X3 [Rhododendron vialii]|uniref:LEAF RUST 10 DISEASE-RESISTANCE LOCUS RECEPTOR-LIKE PROTEIN KINASE-like 1.4 isoform X3 n=1 Tax=Rhododendron vialii TaxID=182163 RepID=UPI00265F2010|nr:LEAF RUST 10 DISEASE-RESISTANCE LOCUS RECEPTOR-LIKE PROTEIN KINASE-like 1.4 isoform X3 [Rhododendron vialii]